MGTLREGLQCEQEVVARAVTEEPVVWPRLAALPLVDSPDALLWGVLALSEACWRAEAAAVLAVHSRPAVRTQPEGAQVLPPWVESLEMEPPAVLLAGLVAAKPEVP